MFVADCYEGFQRWHLFDVSDRLMMNSHSCVYAIWFIDRDENNWTFVKAESNESVNEIFASIQIPLYLLGFQLIQQFLLAPFHMAEYFLIYLRWDRFAESHAGDVLSQRQIIHIFYRTLRLNHFQKPMLGFFIIV